MGKRPKDAQQSSERRRLINDGLMMLCTVVVLAAMVVAWFIGNNVTKASGMNLAATSVGAGAFDVLRLYPTGTAQQHDVEIGGVYYNWTPVANIDFTNMQPNEVQRYKVVVDGGSTAALQFSVNSATRGTTAATAAPTTAPANAEPYELFNFLSFRQMAEDAALTDYTAVNDAENPPLWFNVYAAAGHGTFVDGNLRNVSFPVVGHNNQFVFDLYMNKSACPDYSGVVVSGYVEPVE